MNKSKIEHLDEAIRHSLEEECAVRNSRTNWFMVFQAALGGGVLHVLLDDNLCLFSHHVILVIISLIGSISSISFWYAGWRSEKAVNMLLAFWDELRWENELRIKDFYPVIPLTDTIIDKYFTHSYDGENFDDSVWECKLANRMGLKKSDKWKNKLDKYIMPYKFIPISFGCMWLIFFCSILISTVGPNILPKCF